MGPDKSRYRIFTFPGSILLAPERRLNLSLNVAQCLLGARYAKGRQNFAI
jgi:hypothetical protein